MTITFRNKKKQPRSDRKVTPMREKIDVWLQKNQDMFQGNINLQLHQIRRIESELLSNYGSIDKITDEVLLHYFRLKLYFPRTPYNKKLIDRAIIITKQLDDDKDEYVEAEALYNRIKPISEFADSTVYAWFKNLNTSFTTVGVYHINIVVMIVYLALVKSVKDIKKMKAS
ncbi:hypothetical protein [Nostoc phage YongM]|nr:hypothetical protein [Nostoc phage YongM]